MALQDEEVDRLPKGTQEESLFSEDGFGSCSLKRPGTGYLADGHRLEIWLKGLSYKMYFLWV